MEQLNIDGLLPEEREKLIEKLLKEKAKRKAVHLLFEEQVKQTPDAPAVMWDNQSITYSELNKKANILSNSLLDLGVKQNEKIGICIDPSLDSIIGVLATLKLGCAYVPLLRDFSADYLSHIIGTALISLIIASENESCGFDQHRVKTLFLPALFESIRNPKADNPNIDFSADGSFCILYRNRHGIRLSHQGVRRRIAWLQDRFSLTSKDIVLYRHDLLLDESIREVFWPLLCGGCVIVQSKEQKDDVSLLREYMCKATIAGVSASEIARLREAFKDIQDKETVHTRLVFHRGRVSHFALGCPVVRYRSLPETSGEFVYSLLMPGDEKENGDTYSPTYLPLCVLNEERQPVPVGGKGGLYVGGEGIAQGVIGIKEGPDSAFVKNPFPEMQGSTLYRTGFEARILRDGRIEMLKPRDKRREAEGFRFDLNEIEAALLDDPAVRDCTVLDREDSFNRIRLIAYVVGEPGASYDRIDSSLKKKLPSYMHPDAFVPLKAIPLRETGEIDHDALKKVEVIDSYLRERWKDTLLRFPGIDNLAVISCKKEETLHPIHLSKLFPSIRRARLEAEPEVIARPSLKPDSNQRSKGRQNRPALSHGELSGKTEGPSSLTEVLSRTEEEASEKGILYLQPDGGEIFQSYGDLQKEAKKLLHGLQKQGLKPKDRVLFQLESNQDFIELFWGCILGGFIPVPLSPTSLYTTRTSDTEKLYRVWQLLDKPLIVAGDSNYEDACNLRRGFDEPHMRIEPIRKIRDASQSREVHHGNSHDLALILFTSGSTGTPKGVMLTHRNIISRSAGTQSLNDFNGNDTSLNWMPLDHVGGIVMFHIRDLFVRCKQIHVPKQSILANPLLWLDLIERFRATVTWAPNFAFGLINDHAKEIMRSKWDLSSMRFILNGGEAIVSKTARQFLRLLIPHKLSPTCMKPAYGMSETSSGITYSHSFTLDTTSDDDSFVSVGAPISGTSVRIVDKENRLMKENEIGQVQVKGPTVTPGYYKNPEVTKEVFTSDGWFITGDVGYLCDGKLTITGRAKEVIIINGINYFCHEIESTVDEVEGVVPSYTAACAVRRSDADTDMLAVFFHCAYEERKREIVKRIRERVLRKNGIHPEYIVPLNRDEIPKTAIGKIQRKRLAQRLADGDFDDILVNIDILSENRNTLPDWFYRKVWRPEAISTQVQDLSKTNCILFSDRMGLCEHVRKGLESSGYHCISIEKGKKFTKHDPSHYQINLQKREDYDRFIDSLLKDNTEIHRILHFTSYYDRDKEISCIEELKHYQYEGCFSILFLVQALAQRMPNDRSVQFLVVSNHAQLLPGDERLDCEKATIFGLIKSINIELPWIQCRHIDFDAGHPERDAQFILHELDNPKKEPEIAYRRNRRYSCGLLKLDLAEEKETKLPITEGGIYLITGGLGGIGTYLSLYLMRTYQARLILLGRTVLPPRTEWDSFLKQDSLVAERIRNYLDIEATGREFLYHTLDLTDSEELKEAVSQAERRWKAPLSGIFHLAGEGDLREHWKKIDSHWIVNEQLDAFDSHFRSKVYGTWLLGKLLENREGCLFVSFSSVNSFFGSASFGAYSAANSFLDSYTLDRHARWKSRAFCFNWSMWKDTGMSAGSLSFAEDAARRKGYFVISREQGLYSFLAGFCSDQPQIFVGLDKNHPDIQWHIALSDCALNRLNIFFTAKNGERVLPELQKLAVEDRFKTRSAGSFIELEELPLNEVGEIDEEKLRTIGEKKTSGPGPDILPRNDVEHLLVEIWKEVLGVPVVGLYDNFFELGGNSLRATQLVARINKTFMIEVPLKLLFEEPTVDGLSRLLPQYERKQGQLKAVAQLQRKISGMSESEIQDLLKKSKKQ